MNRSAAAGKVLLLFAIICFVLAALGVDVSRVSLGWLGLAFFAAAALV